MIVVQIYYTVYDRRTRVLYAVAVAVAGLCRVATAGLCRVAVAVAEYAVWYAGLCDMIYNTTLYGIQY